MISKEEALESLSKLGISITEEWNNKYDGISHYKRIKQYLTSSPLDICKDCLDKDNCISQEDCLDNDIEEAIERMKQSVILKENSSSIDVFYLKNSFKNDLTTITTALRDKDREIATFKRRAKSHRLKAIEFNTKLDKIKEMLEIALENKFNTLLLIYELEQIIGDDSNE